jgi:hypothetical protein
MFSPDRAALLLVDVQQAFTHPARAFGPRSRATPFGSGSFAQLLSTDALIDGS